MKSKVGEPMKAGDIHQILNIAQAELRAMYKRLSINGSNVLYLVDKAVIETSLPKCDACDGTGEIEKNIQRDGYPEMDVPIVCDECKGTGTRPASLSAPAGKEPELKSKQMTNARVTEKGKAFLKSLRESDVKKQPVFTPIKRHCVNECNYPECSQPECVSKLISPSGLQDALEEIERLRGVD